MGGMKTAGASAFDALVATEAGPAREAGIDALIAQMTLKEKVAQLTGSQGLFDLAIMPFRYNYKPFTAGANRRLGIPPLRFTDGPRGVALHHSTCFPVPMARGATFDVELEERVGEAMGVEARAQGADLLGSVCINLLRHPGWGRAQETFGEDPHHLGEMGVAQVRGLQRHVMACVKHFACNSIEESRFKVDVRVDERTLREVYLPHFKKCIDAGAACVMSAYNQVNGEWCGHHAELQRKILRDEWGFDGYVISDFVFCVRDGVAGIEGGLDVEMPFPWRYGRRLRKRVERGEVSEALIDGAVRNVLRQKLRFAPLEPATGVGRARVACGEHVELAREVARKSIVLLKNESDVLPLDVTQLRRVAVLGPLADVPNIGDRGSSRVRPPRVVTALQGIKGVVGDRVEVHSDRGGNLARARKLAREADVVVLVVGLGAVEEGEYIPFPRMGGDRMDLDLPRAQRELIEAVAEENSRCAVVLEGGSAITVRSWVDRVPALLMAWYPGMEGGRAIAEILFGAVSPSGKLPLTFPRSGEQEVPFDKTASRVTYGYDHGYRHFDRQGLEPEFPFGFGLSYTRYAYDELAVRTASLGAEDTLRIEVRVTNAGEWAGEEVAQLYIGFDDSVIQRAPRELKGFQRVRLDPGESRQLHFELPVSELAHYDAAAQGWCVEPMTYGLYVGGSSDPSDLLASSFRIATD